jgi:hypothetical protein
MADEKQHAILKQDVDAWNEWRQEPNSIPLLDGTNLRPEAAMNSGSIERNSRT